MKYTVFVMQWAQELAEIEIEAKDMADAIEEAEEAARTGEVDWSDGNDSSSLRAYKVTNADGKIVFED